MERMLKPFIYHVTYARTHSMPQRKEINNEYAWLAPGTRSAPLWGTFESYSYHERGYTVNILLFLYLFFTSLSRCKAQFFLDRHLEPIYHH